MNKKLFKKFLKKFSGHILDSHDRLGDFTVILSADGLPVVISEEFDEMAFPYCKTEQESARAAITRLGVPL